MRLLEDADDSTPSSKRRNVTSLSSDAFALATDVSVTDAVATDAALSNAMLSNNRECTHIGAISIPAHAPVIESESLGDVELIDETSDLIAVEGPTSLYNLASPSALVRRIAIAASGSSVSRADRVETSSVRSSPRIAELSSQSDSATVSIYSETADWKLIEVQAMFTEMSQTKDNCYTCRCMWSLVWQ